MPENMTTCDCLCSLPESHIVRQEQLPCRQESLDALPLIGVKRPLELLDCVSNLSRAQRVSDQSLQLPSFSLEEAAERGVSNRCGCSARNELDQVLHELEPALGSVREPGF